MSYKFRKKLYEDATNNSFEEKVAEVKRQLQNGTRPKYVFDVVNDFFNGFAEVKLGDKCNFIDRNGNILSDLWFDWVASFDWLHEDFVAVQLGRKYNFIDRNGNILSEDLWFDWVGKFHNGFARVELNGKWNFIKPDGNLIRDDLWFDDVEPFDEGFARVELNGKWYYLDKKGNLYDGNKYPINNVTENRRRVLRITESQLRNTIKRVVTQYLNESRRR